LKAHGVYFYEQVNPDEALEALQGFLNKPISYETEVTEIDLGDTMSASDAMFDHLDAEE